MKSDSNPEPISRAEIALRYTWIGVVVVALVVGWVLYSRWDENRRAVRKAEEERRQEDARVAEMFGGNRFEILQFYASPAEARIGEAINLCYGVSNAKSVKLEPQPNAVWPSFSRCLSVTPPTGSTTYSLTAEDGAGHTKTASVTVEVH
jgi:hypothetical protein